MERARNHRRVVAVQGAPDRLGASEIDEALRQQLATLNVNEAETALHGLAEGSAGRVERDLAAIGRLAADGAVETLWFDFTASVNGTLDRESGAIEFATGERRGREPAGRNPCRRRAAAARAARDLEGRQGRHGAQRRPRRDGLDGTGDGGTQVRAGLTGFAAGRGGYARTAVAPRRSDADAAIGRVRHPAVGACPPARAQRPGPRGSNPSRQPKRIRTSLARESSTIASTSVSVTTRGAPRAASRAARARGSRGAATTPGFAATSRSCQPVVGQRPDPVTRMSRPSADSMAMARKSKAEKSQWPGTVMLRR